MSLESMMFASLTVSTDWSPSGSIQDRADVPRLTTTQVEHTNPIRTTSSEGLPCMIVSISSLVECEVTRLDLCFTLAMTL